MLKQKRDEVGENINSIISETDFDILIEALKYGGIGAAIGIAIIPAILIVMCLTGFTCFGVAAGSYAALRQSEIGMVPARSCFSMCQSISTNPFTYKLIPLFGLIGFIVGIICYFVWFYRP